MIVALVIFFLLILRIGWIQFVNGAELKESASRQQTLNKIISPKRLKDEYIKTVENMYNIIRKDN